VRADGVVKVLDFGLAKAMDSGLGTGGRRLEHASMAPTITTPALMTGVGMILGTAAYMSPEQARGKAVDKRADIWAFGAVLFEMLTGKRAFEAEDVSMTPSMVLQRETDFAVLPSTVAARVTQALRVCRHRPRESGGEAATATTLAPGEAAHRFPQFLPDGDHFLFFVEGSPQIRGSPSCSRAPTSPRPTSVERSSDPCAGR
jgi:serine/threonine protein kinase